MMTAVMVLSERTGPCRLAPIWLFASLALALAAFAAAVPVHEVKTSDIERCSVQQPPVNPDVIRCAPNATATLEDAQAIAWKFAPVLKFHPLELYHPQSMNTWFDSSTIYLTDFKQYPNSSYNYVVANQTNFDLLGPKTFATLLNSTTDTEAARREKVLEGAPFVDGKSTADMFYTVTDYSDSLWLYNYNLFYSWNGCSNQNVALSFNGTTDTQGYLMCPAGVHEADLERMSMLVCKSEQKIKQIAYSQHAWSEVRDCQIEGQCQFDEVTGNPISYVALEGHGNYPESPGNGLHVYYYQGSSIDGFPLENIGGIYVGDRTGDDPSKTWIPTPDNVKYIPPLWEIQEAQNGVINGTSWQWATFPGNWGAPLVQAPLKLFCLDRSAQNYVDCNENSTTIKAIYTIVDVLGMSKVIQDQEDVTSSFAIESVTNLTRVPYPDITGPLFRAFSYQYVAGDTAPILTEPVYMLTCPTDVVGLDSIPTAGMLDASADTIVWYLIGITIGTIIFSILLICLLSLPVILDKTGNVQNYVARKYKKYRRKSDRAVGGQETGRTDVDEDVEDEDEDEDVSGDDGQVDADADTHADLSHRSISMTSSTVSSKSAYIMSVDTVLSKGQLDRLIVWGVFASALFIAGITLTAIGLDAMFNKSILTVAADKLQQDSLVSALYWLTTGLSIFIVVVDVIMFFMVWMFQDRRIKVSETRSLWNPFGGRKWFMDRALTILSIIVGLLAMIIAICAVLFGLGLLITIAQLVARVACNGIFSIELFGQSTQSVCLDVPSLGINSVCGWEALQTCGLVTDMLVRNLLIGAMLLLWCHIVWMVVMLSILETYRTHHIKLTKNKTAKAMGLDGVAASSTT